MGITVGLIPDIMDKLSLVGINALCIATASSLSIAIVLKIFHLRTRPEGGEKIRLTPVKQLHSTSWAI